MWDFGDGDTLSLPLGSGAGSIGPISHVYKAPGIYTITLVVNDDQTHKTIQTDTIGANYSFYTTGTPIIGDTISFHFSASLPSGINLLWTFGDGTTSTDSTPYHVYSTAGNFTVKLTVNGNPSNPDIFKTISIYQDPVYTHQMTNTRLWHGTSQVYPTNTNNDTAGTSTYTTLADQSFALQYIDEVVVDYNYTPFNYDPSLSSNDVIVYSIASAYGYYSTIYYYHDKDSIVINYYTNGSAHGSSPKTDLIKWHSP